MSYLKYFMILALSLVFTNQFVQASTQSKLIVLITNSKNLGETSQIKGVARELLSDVPNAKIKEFASDNIDSAIDFLSKNTNSKNLVIAAGSEGINSLRQIKSKIGNIFSVHLSHQIYNNHESLLLSNNNPNGANLIALPKHIIDKKFENLALSSSSKLIETIGVSHNLQKAEIEKAYEKSVLEIPGTVSDKYALVILGGDVENTDKSWSYFTQSNSIKLAKIIAKLIDKDTYIFVLNGPRTGKHNASTGKEDSEAHRGNKIDAVTQSFMDQFANRDKIYLFDFQYGKSGMYRPLLGKMLHSLESKIFIPGESTSMVSEIVDTVGSNDKHKIFVYEHSAINKNHKSHILEEHKNGRIFLLSKNGTITRQITPNGLYTQSAAKLIADNIEKNWIRQN